ncbi:cation-translocating P-type ATPase [Baaleninema simplex]|uniref:cation-translocating P-type ATPase n=1 Tax=Baaleninema simplex TaxID=2862350 RepID=UPI000347EDAD|nr:cation-translocating P-type ATPase [Baaleninema simplex]
MAFSPPSPNPTGYDPSRAWHALSPHDALTFLDSDAERGLTDAQVRQRLQVFGWNEIRETAGRSNLVILWEQFTNVMLLMLTGVAIVSALLDLRQGIFPRDAVAIFTIVILNAILGFFQESRAEKALAALKRLSAPQVRVVRSGIPSEIAAKELVPGDIVLLETGGSVAADARLLEARNLSIREAALTGESEAVSKQADLRCHEEAALGERSNLVFQGTEIASGRGRAVVTKTGMNTEIGQIATLLQSVESEATPLQQRMAELANVLVLGSLLLVAFVVSVGVLQTGWSQFRALLEVSLSMAVAVVPEGLPAVVTVTLAIGTQRMVRHNALIRKLAAVETLGSVTTICSDKTGTLTQNKMVVQWVQTGTQNLSVTGEGYQPSGQWRERTPLHDRDRPSDPIVDRTHPDLQRLLYACILCNDALLKQSGNTWDVIGDATEGALLSLAGKAGLFREAIAPKMPRIAEIPFSSERKRMSVTVKRPDIESNEDAPYLLMMKGSPEVVLERCTQVRRGDRTHPLSKRGRQILLDRSNRMAARGFRVLGLAERPLDTLPDSDADALEQQLVWLGWVGMLDAPRPEAQDAVARCREAGIRPVMITGDHRLTAQAIAYDLGIARPGDRVLTGQELDRLSPDALEEQVDLVSVYARVSPKHKLDIVRALQKRGRIVAMTGDGVNDAPALKQADIGIAMGLTGTDVSKEASNTILLDDNFATIVRATEEGRVVYDNIRRFIRYVLGSNVGEVLTIGSAPLLGLGGAPLSPLQILWMNLVTDGLPALALAMEPAEPKVMQRPPYSPHESIFARGLGVYILRIGVVFSVLTIALMTWGYRYAHSFGDPDRWKTMVFTTLCLAQMGHALAARSTTQLTVELNPRSNLYVWGAVILTTVLQLMLIYVTPLRNFFGTYLLSPLELAVCFGFSLLVFVWLEGEKLLYRWLSRRKKTRAL